MHLLYAFALSFQKSSLIISNLIMITCYHDNSLIGPIAHLSLSLPLSFTSCLSSVGLIFFVVTPTHPSATAITYFNFSAEDSTCTLSFCLLLFCSRDAFCRGKSSCISSCRQHQPAQSQHLAKSPSSKLSEVSPASLRGSFVGRVQPSLTLAWSNLDRPRMQYVLRSRTSKSSAEPQGHRGWDFKKSLTQAGTWGQWGCSKEVEHKTVALQLLLGHCSASRNCQNLLPKYVYKVISEHWVLLMVALGTGLHC